MTDAEESEFESLTAPFPPIKASANNGEGWLDATLLVSAGHDSVSIESCLSDMESHVLVLTREEAGRLLFLLHRAIKSGPQLQKHYDAYVAETLADPL